MSEYLDIANDVPARIYAFRRVIVPSRSGRSRPQLSKAA
jgi:hypothetical protein